MRRTPTEHRPVSASGLTKDYGEGAGVFDLEIEIDAGTIVGFIGPSGSGKTTTIRMMNGAITPDSGTVLVLGEVPSNFRTATRARIGYMPQNAILYPELTLLENLNFAASLFGMPYRRRRLIRRLVDFVDLEGAIRRLPEEASGGEKRRVMLASTLIHTPELIFLDEPTAGVDPVLRRRFWDRFGELAAEGRTLVITTQYVGEAAYCDYVAVMAEGRVLTIDTPEGLRRQAYGGEMIEVRFENAITPRDNASLRTLPDVLTSDWAEPDLVRVVVRDPEVAREAISPWASERSLVVTKAEAYLPPFDDVFVELVSKISPSGQPVERVG